MQLSSTHPGTDILSQWQVRLIESQAYLLSDSSATPGIVWHVDLPRNPYTARRMLQQQRRYQAETLRGLPHVEQRLRLFTDQIASTPGDDERYGVEIDEFDWPAPERALYTWLDNAQRGEAFTIMDDLKETGQQIANLYQMLARLGKGDDWVETDHDGRPLGRSKISWLGDMDTYLVPGISYEVVVLHQQHVHSCQEARLIWVRIGLMTTAFAVRLASSLAIPTSWITAARPILRFIKQVFDEYKRLSQTTPNPLE